MRRIGEVVARDDVQTGIADDVFAQLDIGALEADDQRHLEAHFFHRRDHAFGDDVAAHDAAEDVDEDAFDVGVRGDDLEGLGHLFLGGTAADVKEVRRFRAVKLDDVHGGHGKACAVDHAADFTVQRDVVQIELGRGEFFGVFLGLITQGGDVGVAVDGVAVKAHLGVEQLQGAVFQHAEGVDLDHVHVFVDKEPVKVADDADALFDLRAFEAKAKGDAAAVEILKAGGRVDVEGQDLFGGVMGDIFDAHPAFGGGDDGDAAGFAVDQQGEVKFAVDVAAVFDVDAVHHLASRAGLDGDKGAAQHLAGKLGGFTDRTGQTHAALFARFGFDEMALAAPTGVDLRLDHPERAIQLTCGGLGLFGLHDGPAVGHRDAIAAQERLGLIFVDIHGRAPVSDEFGRS